MLNKLYIDTYADTINATNFKCALCNSTMTNCISCSSSAVCNQCGSSKYLKPDKTGCLTDCSTLTSNKIIQNNEK